MATAQALTELDQITVILDSWDRETGTYTGHLPVVERLQMLISKEMRRRRVEMLNDRVDRLNRSSIQAINDAEKYRKRAAAAEEALLGADPSVVRDVVLRTMQKAGWYYTSPDYERESIWCSE